ALVPILIGIVALAMLFAQLRLFSIASLLKEILAELRARHEIDAARSPGSYSKVETGGPVPISVKRSPQVDYYEPPAGRGVSIAIWIVVLITLAFIAFSIISRS
ncbi:MAG: hypothetical protein HY046_03125, partial [Acidobacteria bacterium]|nr:hypothetical protein [Acidobacteriota bacterium]